jgi:hypothetical protein
MGFFRFLDLFSYLISNFQIKFIIIHVIWTAVTISLESRVYFVRFRTHM